jgi:hypothetical protein
MSGKAILSNKADLVFCLF